MGDIAIERGIELTPLCQLARKHETDKGGWHLRYGGGDSDTCHNYTPTYNHLFLYPQHIQRVFEIGINAGSSLRMWADFFPNAHIFAIDSCATTLFETDRIHCYACDQNNPLELLSVMERIELETGIPSVNSFDLIVDDGSHIREHQITSMKTLLPFISGRGWYIIEDLGDTCHALVNLEPGLLPGYSALVVPTGVGLGKAHCHCAECDQKGPEGLYFAHRVVG